MTSSIRLTIDAEIALEVQRAKAKFPKWPVDPLHAVGVINEEIGELNREVLQACYDVDRDGWTPRQIEIDRKMSLAKIRTEAIQSAAMLRRFIEALDEETVYNFKPGEQYSQT